MDLRNWRISCSTENSGGQFWKRLDDDDDDGIDLEQDTENWRAVVKMVMNFWVPFNVGYVLTS